ncbi:hypothetical protein I553_1325 [Mycobacterium xenopi 4042]|uniref:Uncharacterized protein n=1 Tax=Mycobacterium xenopi 4042 TaxID=1299334 RepID=X8CHS2_MYCXE|nr:hypothetical protein I553_1325 [Mycobacterium xenopi 4042]
MTDLTPDDVRRWDAAAVLKVFQVATNRATTLACSGRTWVRQVSCSPTGRARQARRFTAA